MTRQVNGAEEARKLVLQQMTPRAARIAEAERWIAGTQYDHLASWWDEDVSIFLRAPCIVDPIVRAAIDSFVDLVLGEGRFPTITCRPSEDETELESEGGLSQEDGKELDQLLGELQQSARFRRVTREAFAGAMGQGSQAVIWGARAGRLFGETVNARWCTPELAADGSVARLTIQYAYVDETQDARGTWRATARMFRRVIDTAKDTTYAPVDLTDGARADKLAFTVATEVAHGLGFTPVVWYPFMKRCSIVGEYDGQPIHTHLYDEIRAHDMAVSQRHRAALYAGDPQTIEIGVEPGISPTAKREVGHPSSPAGGTATEPKGDNPQNGVYAAPGARQMGRRKGPGEAWQYPSPDTKVTQLTLPAGALQSIDDNAHDIRTKICQSLAVVFMDPENVKFAATVSGKALETLRQRQLDRCDQYREDLADGLILPSVHMLMRIAQRQAANLRVPGLRRAVAMLSRFERAA